MERKYELFGVPITVGARHELLGAVQALLGRGGYVVTVNPLMLMQTRRDAAFFEVVRDADLVIPDGAGVKLALRFFGVRTDVLPGVELAEELIAEGAFRVALYGAKGDTAMRARDAFLSKNPRLCFPSVLDGYTYREEKAEERLLAAAPDILYVCLGAVRQEEFIARFCKRKKNTLAIGLGGSFDVIGGCKRRAPRLFRALRLEWLYRMLKEPRRLRGLPSLVSFLALCLFQSVCFSRKSSMAKRKN